MGGGNSKEESPSPSSSSSSWASHQSYTQSGPGSYNYPPPPTYNSPAPAPSPAPSFSHHFQQPYTSYSQEGYPSQPYSNPPPQSADSDRKKFDRRYSKISDNYSSLAQVSEALGRAGLESSNLIVGIDFTKSNEWTGANSFNKKNLHHLSNTPNPYEQAITIVGRTLAAFDEDNLIPCYGFGDASTHDQDVFSFYPEGRFCNGFEEVLARYREIVPQLKLAGPTSFAPIIEMAMTVVEQSRGQYHVLVIIADGQVTRSVDTEHGKLSPQEQKTVDAIVKASTLPLSIVLVGVGDGPWDMMQEFDDNIPARAFDNFQFVNFTEIMSKNKEQSRKETEFALSALMEIPPQYKATIELNLLGGRNGSIPERIPLPPPVQSGSSIYNTRIPSFEPSVPTYPISTGADDSQLCPICLSNPKNMAFGCGHQTCCECGPDLKVCPICRAPIQTRIKLY
ncbi:PREDICTED: E3 ubiquitin-protein ligase RGLG1 [Camelina sativa]|uniref:RING-type E3 ubiquitin transferase n=1 Tax=Camelina sativa TaxID=90675 RepID=A0ABM0U4E7_CAMSA|nr:PREDICTED: E3 ubiquitin-protein ligase RGLG1 [Camelina sativa]XP_010435649.1 PREDICTED: E3 ubiquitin-protein ligase RGLG1 [Camelina sativa]XP_010435650.1 PREDICTED: E3 ubiquitin-protein ligase RGLG1 [Camelina sativa]